MSTRTNWSARWWMPTWPVTRPHGHIRPPFWTQWPGTSTTPAVPSSGLERAHDVRRRQYRGTMWVPCGLFFFSLLGINLHSAWLDGSKIMRVVNVWQDGSLCVSAAVWLPCAGSYSLGSRRMIEPGVGKWKAHFQWLFVLIHFLFAQGGAPFTYEKNRKPTMNLDNYKKQNSRKERWPSKVLRL